MSREERTKKSKSTGSGKNRKTEEAEMVTNALEQIRTLDSEIDLLKQKMNLVIREINVIKRVVLSEKEQIKELEVSKGNDDKRFTSLLNIVKGMRETKE